MAKLRIHILSDLHLEFEKFLPSRVKADVVVLAGDTHVGTRGIAWAAKQFTAPVIYVLGNHEYFEQVYPTMIAKAKDAAKGTNVHVLENDFVDIGGVRFLGCTLWTDFDLLRNPEAAARSARRIMIDYHKISVAPTNRKLLPSDTLIAHRKSVEFLKENLTGAPSRTVVVTHHAPSMRSIAPERRRDALSASYASNLEKLICDTQPPLWIHGHTHYRTSYKVGQTRVISNPRGYPEERYTGFWGEVVVEV